MSIQSIVLPSQQIRGLAKLTSLEPIEGIGVNGEPVTPQGVLTPIADILEGGYETDAHFTAYRVFDSDGEPLPRVPRLRKESYQQIRAEGGRVSCGLIALDLDLCHQLGSKSKISWKSLSDLKRRELRQLFIKGAEDFAPYFCVYATQHGVRFIHLLAMDVPAGRQYEHLLSRYHTAYRDAGLMVDPACRDWTRLYRAPSGQDWIHFGDPDSYNVPPQEFMADEDPLTTQAIEHQISRGQPSQEESESLLYEFRDGSRVQTELHTTLRQKFQTSTVFPNIFGDVPFSGGSRHDSLLRLCGILVRELRNDHDPETAYALASRACALLDSDEDWYGKAWEMITSFWSRTPTTQSILPQRFQTQEEVPFVDEVQVPDDFIRNKEGKPFPGIVANMRFLLHTTGAHVSYNEFSQEEQISGLPGFPYLDDAAINYLWITAIEDYEYRENKDFFFTAISKIAKENSFHPVRDYLEALEWDGTPRVESWLHTYLGAEESPYTRSIAAVSLVAAVRRIFEPGCKHDNMLILEAVQGSYKSSTLRALAVRDSWFSDDMPLTSSSKEVIERTSGKWIVEAGELQGLGKRDANSLKAFLSRGTETARMAYARRTISRPRQFVVFGTTNEDHYLQDQTGNRRFWPVKINKGDVVSLRRDVDQLWAEATHMYLQHQHLEMDASLYSSATREQEKRHTVSSDPWLETLRDTLNDMEGVFYRDDLWQIIGLTTDKQNHQTSQRFCAIMRHMGFERKQVWHPLEQRLKTAWHRGEGPKHRIIDHGRGKFKVKAMLEDNENV